MPAFEVIVQIKKDGVDVPGFPYRRVIETAEGTEFNVVKAGGDSVPQPFPGLIVGSSLQMFLAAPDQPLTFVPGGAAGGDGLINLGGGGLFLLVYSNQQAGSGDQIEVKNAGATAANIKGAWASS